MSFFFFFRIKHSKLLCLSCFPVCVFFLFFFLLSFSSSGFGLSYSSFKYTVHAAPTFVSHATVRSALLGKRLDDVAAAFYVNVTNTGNYDADDAVLGFLQPPGAGTQGVPLQQLFGFERVFVPKGQTVTVYLGAQMSAFTQVRHDGSRLAWPGAYTFHFGVRETATHVSQKERKKKKKQRKKKRK